MPWMETSAVEQRVQFVWDFTSGQWTMTELCERYGITRPTGYKWMQRYRDAGEAGLAEPRAACVSASDGGIGGDADPGRPQALRLGREKAAAGAHAARSDACMAG